MQTQPLWILGRESQYKGQNSVDFLQLWQNNFLSLIYYFYVELQKRYE